MQLQVAGQRKHEPFAYRLRIHLCEAKSPIGRIPYRHHTIGVPVMLQFSVDAGVLKLLAIITVITLRSLPFRTRHCRNRQEVQEESGFALGMVVLVVKSYAAVLDRGSRFANSLYGHSRILAA